jgi:phage terminase large subunit
MKKKIETIGPGFKPHADILCAEIGCHKPPAQRGLCKACYAKAHRRGAFAKMQTDFTCIIPGCGAPPSKDGLCASHYAQAMAPAPEKPRRKSSSGVKEVVLDYTPREQFLSYHERTQRHAIIVAHRRCGKTVATINDLLMRAAQTPNGRFAYIAPFYSQAKDVAWEYVKHYAHPLLADQPSEAELRVDLVNGARIRLYGADNPDRLRGLGFDAIVCDEFADFRSGVWSEVLRPALADRQGWVTFIGTPKGRNEFWQLYQLAKTSPAWFRVELKASKTAIILQEELDAAKEAMSKEQYAQEFECSFDSALVGAFYADELERAKAQGRITRLPIDRAVPVHTCWDLGVSDSTAIWFCQVVGKERRLIDYYEASGVGLDHYAKVLEEKDYVWGDHWFPHDIANKELSTGLSRVDTLRGLGIEPEIVPQAAVLDGINAVRRMLDSTWIDPERCERGLEALKQYRREWNDKMKTWSHRPRHDWSSHGADALRTFAMGFEERSTAKKQKRPRWMPRMTGSWLGA